jgi:predicted MPP superfamily phosphohydrolase
MASEAKRLIIAHSNLAILGLMGLLGGFGYYGAKRRPPVVEVDVAIPNLPEALNGFRIVQISDIHVGPTLGRSFVEHVVAQSNALSADLVAITGDLVDGSVAELADDVAPLAGLQSRHGSFFVTGNHEYYSGVEPWMTEVQRLGVRLLHNTHHLIEHDGGRLLLAGVPDYNGATFGDQHRSDPKRAALGAPQAEVKVLLAHQPRSIDAAEQAGFDLVLSGHTHGGQIFPWNFAVRLQQPFVAGLHRRGKTQIYVSRGTGYWGPPLRLWAPSEITLIRLRPASL